MKFFTPLGENIVFVPKSTLCTDEMNQTSLLVCIIGLPSSMGKIVDAIQSLWKSDQKFQVTRVNEQSYKISFGLLATMKPSSPRNGIGSLPTSL